LIVASAVLGAKYHLLKRKAEMLRGFIDSSVKAWEDNSIAEAESKDRVDQAKTVKTRQPQSYAVGECSESAGNVLEISDHEIKEIVALYRCSFKRV
jgi:hypothetical protein